jgi:hypothetical protein
MSQRLMLVPMCPTPNGRLHIGHGAGSYLRADAIARASRRDGHERLLDTLTRSGAAVLGPERVSQAVPSMANKRSDAR